MSAAVQEIISDVKDALVSGAKTYCDSSGIIGTARVPEAFYEVHFFHKYMNKYPMTCQTRVMTEILEGRSSDNTFYRGFRKRVCDLVIYTGEPNVAPGKRDLLAIMEFKNGWADIDADDKDMKRSIELLQHLKLPHDTVAISCWLESKEQHSKKCEMRRKKCDDREYELDDKECHRLHDGEYVSCVIYKVIGGNSLAASTIP